MIVEFLLDGRERNRRRLHIAFGQDFRQEAGGSIQFEGFPAVPRDVLSHRAQRTQPLAQSGPPLWAEIVNEFCGVRIEPKNVNLLAGMLKAFIEKPEMILGFGLGGAFCAKELCDPKQQLIAFRKILSEAIR